MMVRHILAHLILFGSATIQLAMSTLFVFLSVCFLLAVSALLSGLTLGLLSLSHFELKRKAQMGVRDAVKVYPIRARGHELLVTLILTNVLVNASITALLDSKLFGPVAVLFSALFITIFAEILPQAYLKKHGLRYGAKLSPVINKLLLIFHPVSAPLGRFLDRVVGEEQPVIYTKDELFKIIEEHKQSPYSEIETDELNIVRHALSFGDKIIREYMTPRNVVSMVSASDTLGPVLLDELHSNGHSRFPVLVDGEQDVVGILYLHDLVISKEDKHIKDVMRREVYYVHEEQTLDHALKAFIKTKHHLFIVINSFEEFVGIITIEDILEQIIGKKIVDEFDKYDDLREVAALRAKEVRHHRLQAVKKPIPTLVPDEDVVE
jgi:metal transporter CNNM